MRENGPWSMFFTDRAVNELPPSWLNSWTGHGMISRVPSPEIRNIVAAKHIPVVDLNEQTGDMGVPLISNDHAAIGRMAAEHLIDRGFRQFAFLGHTGHRWSDRRGETFAKTVRSAGYDCEIYAGQVNRGSDLREGAWNVELDQLALWAASLPKPVGMMACTDFRALQLLTACQMAGVAVPEQAAVLGVGADDVACALSDPPLSSIVLNAWRMGYEAAALLDRMMKGEKVPRGFEMPMPPLEVSVRQSTDVVAISDPMVANAVRFIRKNADKGINVEDVLRQLGVSRTTLQEHFRNALGSSIHDLIVSTRLSRVKQLLSETDLTLAEVSMRCGFRHVEYMSGLMRQHTGSTPGQFRREHGLANRPQRRS
ncbi:DNA-binding transcriptional regulator [Granulicella sp. dw_53]|uniref:XylR family transcriptional regulator n=1 Tax=Granulicella sp. dw_53 TaxID=2719792 RepID=UPI001BD605A2